MSDISEIVKVIFIHQKPNESNIAENLTIPVDSFNGCFSFVKHNTNSTLSQTIMCFCVNE